MAQFSTYDRANDRRDSPLFWLLVLAGSLVLHLAVLLLGRWYLTQTSRSQVAGSSKAIEFVEVDPNASISRSQAIDNAKLGTIAPSNTEAKSSLLPQNAPPSGDTAEPSTASIQSFTASPPPVRSRPSPSPQPLAPVTQPDQQRLPETPSNRPQSTNPEPDRQAPRPSPTPSTNPSTRPVPPSSEGSSTSPFPDPQTSSRPAIPDPQPDGKHSNPATSTPDSRPFDPSTPEVPEAAASGTPLPPVNSSSGQQPLPSGVQTYQGQIVGQLTIPPYAGQTSAKSAVPVSPLQSFDIEPDQIDPARDLSGETVVELRVNFSIDNETEEFLRINGIEDDSPILLRRPELNRDRLKEIARNLLEGTKYKVVVEPGPNGNISPESDWQMLLRIDITPAS